MAGQRTRIFGWCEPSAYCRKHDGTQLAHSSVHVDGSVGECELHMASGQVQLDRIDALQANISAGEVAIGHIAGRADIDGGAFAVRIGEVEGTVGIASSGGRAWIGHASADLDLSSGSGGFDIDRADGSVTAKTGDGAIRIGRLTRGPAELLNGSGNIEIGISEGTVGIASSGARAWIGHASADLDLSSGSGDFDIDRADGSVTATTGSGAIRIGRMTHGQAKLTNGSGNIEVGISEGTAASVDVNSERGAVHDFVSSHGNPDPSDRKVMVHARTRHGDIIIQRAAS